MTEPFVPPKARGFNQFVTPSPALAAVIGHETRLRTQVTKDLWAYIRKHGLQDTENRRMINADEALLRVFGKPQVSMFQMSKHIAQHLRLAAQGGPS